MPYRIEFLADAKKDLTALPMKIQKQVSKKIDALTINPRPSQCIKLTTPGDFYRIRSGDYRIVYTIKDEVLIVLVVRVAHRREVYRDLP